MNSNIRCIEIALNSFASIAGTSWIVTLDVLKCDYVNEGKANDLLNSNIRCIEIENGLWIITIP